MTSRRIAFLDVDGTILDHGRTVQASTVDAIRAARTAGHLVYLSTGRAAGDIHPAVREIGVDGAITNGGAYAKSGDKTIVAELMPRVAVERLIAWFEAEGIAYFLQTDDRLYATPAVRELVHDYMRRYWPAHRRADEPQTAPQKLPRFHDLADADLDLIAKAVFLSERSDAVARAQAELGDAFHVVPGSMPLPAGSNGEIGMRGTNKGTAVLAVLDHLGMDAASAIGIGDSWNDIEMLQVCGLGIAMGNADDALKAVADEVTTSVRDHGVATAFRRHGLA